MRAWVDTTLVAKSSGFPFSGERQMSPNHPLLRSEATFPQTLEIVRALDVGRVILTHVEEPDGLGHDDLTRLAERVRADGLPVDFAYDAAGNRDGHDPGQRLTGKVKSDRSARVRRAA